MLKQRHSSQTLQEVHQDFVLGGQFTVSIQPRNAQNKDTTRIHCAFRCRHEGRRHDANCTLSTTNLRTTRQGLAFKKKNLTPRCNLFFKPVTNIHHRPPPFLFGYCWGLFADSFKSFFSFVFEYFFYYWFLVWLYLSLVLGLILSII